MQLNKKLKDNENKFWIFFIVLCGLTLIMINSFMTLDKINSGHDIYFHYRRFNALMESIKNGNYPVYIDFKAFNNYGYGTKWFYPDLTLIPFALIENITSFIFAYKIMWFTMTILCGILTYKMVTKISDDATAAIFISLLYTFSTYRLQDMYERGAVGEALSFTFIPIVFWGLYEIIKGDYKKWYIISIGFTLLIYTHLISAILTFITSLIFIFIYYKDFLKQPKRLYCLIFGGITSILLSSYFILPFIEQVQNIHFTLENMKYTEETLNIKQVLQSLLYPIGKDTTKYFHPSIGILMVTCLFIRIFINKKTKFLKCADIIGIIGIIYIILTINIVSWNNYPLKIINFIQFPWRLFELSTFFFSIAGGYYLSLIINKKRDFVIVSLVLIITIAGLIKNSSIYRIENADYIRITDPPKLTMNENYFFFFTVEYFPQNLNLNIITHKGQKIDTKKNIVTISDIKRKDGYLSCNITTDSNDYLEFPLTYYKGYTATLNNSKIEVEESKKGLVEVHIDKSGKLVVEYTGTFLQKYSIYISLISFIICIIYIFRYNKILKRKKLNA